MPETATRPTSTTSRSRRRARPSSPPTRSSRPTSPPSEGATRGALQDAIVQEVDIKTGLVMFEWHAYGHVALDDSYWPRPASPATPWDYFHVNSISLDPWGDGNFLISARNTWAGYEIDHDTGQVLWRLGGRYSSFKMDPGTGDGVAARHQLAARPYPDAVRQRRLPAGAQTDAHRPRAHRLERPHRAADRPGGTHAVAAGQQPGQRPAAAETATRSSAGALCHT